MPHSSPNSDYGLRVRDAFLYSVSHSGGQVIALQQYERQPAAMMAPVKSLANYETQTLKLRGAPSAFGQTGAIAGPPTPDQATLDRLMNYQSTSSTPFDAVLLPEGGTLLRALAPLLPYYDVDPHKVKFLGTGLWDDPVIGREPALVGGWFAAPPPDARKAFLDRFQSAYGTTPPRLASISFDAVALAGALARPAEGSTLLHDDARQPQRLFRASTASSVSVRTAPRSVGLAVLEVTPNGFVVVSPAPATFETKAF